MKSSLPIHCCDRKSRQNRGKFTQKFSSLVLLFFCHADLAQKEKVC